MLALLNRKLILWWRNRLQCREIMRPEIAAILQQRLGRKPTRTECYLEWCESGAKQRFDAKHPFPQRPLVVALASTRWFCMISRFTAVL